MAFTNPTDELNLPTVIINIPELHKAAARKKVLHILLLFLMAFGFVALVSFIYMILTVLPKEMVNSQSLEVTKKAQGSLELTIKLSPENVEGVEVEVDGKIITGNPHSVYLSPTEEYHSIRVYAPGYGNVNKDVQVTASEVVAFTLIPTDATLIAANESSQRATQYKLGTKENEPSVVTKKIYRKKSGEKQTAKKERRLPQKKEVEHANTADNRQKEVALATNESNVASTSAVIPTQVATASARPTAAAIDSATSNRVPHRSTPIPSSQLYRPAQASLIINTPHGVSNRVAVSLDGQRRGYLPILLMVDAGLHELTFEHDGNRSFQMVKLNAGQIVRIIPKL